MINLMCTSEHLSKYSSVLGIRVGVPHLTKFDMGGVRCWRVRTLGVALMRPRGIDALERNCVKYFSSAKKLTRSKRYRQISSEIIEKMPRIVSENGHSFGDQAVYRRDRRVIYVFMILLLRFRFMSVICDLL